MARRALVAVGGNALIRQGQRGTMAEQRENAAITAGCIVQLTAHIDVVALTHGNGPQVGAELIQGELAAAEVSPEPLDVAVAQTQGAIGYVLAQALAAARSRAPVVPVVTQTVVDEHDPAFQQPTKPIGPFYSAEEAQWRARGLFMQAEHAERGVFEQLSPVLAGAVRAHPKHAVRGADETDSEALLALAGLSREAIAKR